MSWAEVYKINNDLDEPLNFTNYIYDISVFAEKSYVMAPMNKKIWENLSLNSMYLYGHTGIRTAVYNHLSPKDVDALFTDSSICGRQLNAFHDFEGCAIGNGLSVISNMTKQTYAILKVKFQLGYERFVDGFLSQEEDVGAWLNETFSFENDTLASLQTMDTILENEEIMTLLLTKEASALAITHSKTTLDKIVANENAMHLITTVLTDLATSPIRYVVDSSVLWDSILQSDDAMTTVFNSESSMYEVIRSEIAMNKIINSTPAMDLIAANTTAMNVIIKAIEDLAKGSASMTTIKNNVTTINTNLPNIIEGDCARKTMDDTTDQITSALDILNPILEKIVIIEKVTRAMADNESAMEAIAASTVAMTAICDSSAALDIVLASVTAMTEIVSNTIAMNVIFASSTARTKFADSSTAVNVLIDNTTAFNTCLTDANMCGALISSQTAMDIIAGSSPAMTRVMAYTDATTRFFNGSFCVGKGLNTYGNIGNSELASRNTFTDICNKNVSYWNAVLNNTPARTKVFANQKAMEILSALSSGVTWTIQNSNGLNALVNCNYYVGKAYATVVGSSNASLLACQNFSGICSNSEAMNAIVSNGYFYNYIPSNATAVSKICSIYASMNCVTKSAVCLNRFLRSDIARTALQKSIYIHGCYDNIYATCNGNSSYFQAKSGTASAAPGPGQFYVVQKTSNGLAKSNCTALPASNQSISLLEQYGTQFSTSALRYSYYYNLQTQLLTASVFGSSISNCKYVFIGGLYVPYKDQIADYISAYNFYAI